MRTLLFLLLVFRLAGALPPPANATTVLDFEDAALGEVLDHKYTHRGVQFTGIGNGGPFPIIADATCSGAASGTFVLSLRVVDDCPEMNDSHGWIQVDFDQPQPRVSIQAIASGPGAVIYFQAYDGQGLIDQKIGQVGSEWVGVPQTLEITREPQDRQITYVAFGALRSGQNAGFDDLSYEIEPVPTFTSSWSAVKSRFGN